MTPEELGYKPYGIYGHYFKQYGYYTVLVKMEENSPIYYGVVQAHNVWDQDNIDGIQIAYNNLQRDLKELNK